VAVPPPTAEEVPVEPEQSVVEPPDAEPPEPPV
jgi:hypothetical protein